MADAGSADVPVPWLEPQPAASATAAAHASTAAGSRAASDRAAERVAPVRRGERAVARKEEILTRGLRGTHRLAELAAGRETFRPCKFAPVRPICNGTCRS